MCEQDYENKKLVITKFSYFLQALNSNFRLSADRTLELNVAIHSVECNYNNNSLDYKGVFEA